MVKRHADEVIIINVKGVPKQAWEQAKRHALQAGEPLGVWLAGAINRRVDLEAGLVKPADNPAIPLTHDQMTARIEALAQLQQGTASMRRETGQATGRATLERCLADLRALLPPQAPAYRGKLLAKPGQDSPIDGQPGMILHTEE